LENLGRLGGRYSGMQKKPVQSQIIKSSAKRTPLTKERVTKSDNPKNPIPLQQNLLRARAVPSKFNSSVGRGGRPFRCAGGRRKWHLRELSTNVADNFIASQTKYSFISISKGGSGNFLVGGEGELLNKREEGKRKHPTKNQ